MPLLCARISMPNWWFHLSAPPCFSWKKNDCVEEGGRCFCVVEVRTADGQLSQCVCGWGSFWGIAFSAVDRTSSASETPNFSSLLMICNVTAVHLLHCLSITWDISPYAPTLHPHTHKWKDLPKLFSYYSLSLLLGRGHIFSAPEDVDSEWRRALWVALRSKVISGSSATSLVAAFHSQSSLSCQQADRRRGLVNKKSI